MIRTRRTRRGFTLVEMMVASAMCILGMWLLAWTFQVGMESFRNARAQAELTDQERMVTAMLTRDLKADHFLDEDYKPNRGRRLSDQRTDLIWSGGYVPPRGGYFYTRSTPGVFEAYDGVAESTRSTNHFLQFTVLLPGGRHDQQFSAEVPYPNGQQWFGTAAEVTYYLVLSPAKTTNGYPLYDLYRQQRIVARTSDDAPAYAMPASDPNSYEVMVSNGGRMRTLADLTVPRGLAAPAPPAPAPPPSYRLAPYAPIGVSPAPPSTRFAEDKLMSNVLSFEVKFTGVAGAGSGINWPAPFPGNTDYPYDNLPFNGEFDTHSPYANWQNDRASASNPNGRLKPIRITGIQIRLRAYEPRTHSTRQTTLTLDL